MHFVGIISIEDSGKRFHYSFLLLAKVTTFSSAAKQV